MVHALHEVHHVLAPDGILVDLRPIEDHWPVEVASLRESREAGRVMDLPVGLADDEAANQSVAQILKEGKFEREKEEFFPFFYYWNSPKEMEKFIAEEWEDFVGIEENVWKDLRSLWAIANADARVCIRVKMLISLWHKK
jgi:hypothetical protein